MHRNRKLEADIQISFSTMLIFPLIISSKTNSMYVLSVLQNLFSFFKKAIHGLEANLFVTCITENVYTLLKCIIIQSC